MEDFVTVDSVAIFDEHDDYTPDILNEIIANCNKRVADTGDSCPLILGHTRNNTEEAEQPVVVGFAENFRIGEIGNVTPRKAIICTFKFYRDKYEQYEIPKQYPRRSIELWTEELFIDPIALLGPSTPKRDLGLLKSQYAKKYRYSLATYQKGELMENHEQIVTELYSKLTESQEFAYVRQLMKKSAEEAQVEPEPKSKEEDAPEDQDKDRLQKDQLRSHVEKFRKENETLKTEFATLQKKFRRAERERDLVRLESVEGIDFDLVEELDIVENLDDAGYAKHLDRMRKRYNRAPIGVNMPIARIPDHGGEVTFTAAQMSQAVELATSKGVKYEEAIQQIKGRV